MKKIISFLVVLTTLLPLTFAQLNVKIDKTFAKQGLVNISELNQETAYTNLHRFDNSDAVLCAGFYSNDDTDESGFIFAKYKANGALDATYAEKGILTIVGLDEYFYNILRIREASDKSIFVLLGDSDALNSDTTGIIRISPNGKQDTLFGVGGILSSNNGLIVDFDVLADGKILTLVNNDDEATQSIINAFERYDAKGALDKAFGTVGSVAFNQALEIFGRMEKTGSGYVLAGASIDLTTFDFNPCIAKVSSSGILDKNFGNIGIALAAPAPKDWEILPSEIKILKNGAFLLSGFAVNTVTDSVVVFLSKIQANGTANTNFAQKGYLFIETVGESDIILMDVEELASGKLLSSATIGNFDDSNISISLQLFSASGAKEKQFGTNGEVILTIEDKQSVVCATEVLPDGKILLVGGIFDEAEQTFGGILTRLSLEYGVSTQEQTTLMASSIYPNPVQDWSSLSYELLEDAIINVQLYDLQGRMVQQIIAPQMRSAGKQTEALEFNSALATGQYLLKIDMADKGYKTLKINKL